MDVRIKLLKDEKSVLVRHHRSVLPSLWMLCGAVFLAIGILVSIPLSIVMENFVLILLCALPGIVMIAWGRHLRPKADIFLTLTNKRLIQDGPFGAYTAIPLEHIVAVSGTDAVLNVHSASARIVLGGVSDSVDLANKIFALINQLQPDVDVDVSVPESPKVAQSSKAAPKPAAKPKEALKPVSTAQPAKPAKPAVDVTPYLGKKFCSGCGELIADSGVSVCPACGSKYLAVITDANAQNIIPNIEKH